MSNQSQSMSHEELVAANAALQAQVEYLAKEVANLTKEKMSMLRDSEDEEEASSSATMRARAHEKSHSDFKGYIPIFEGKNDPDEFLEWLETVERVFDFMEISDEKKVKIVALKFQKYASTWWTNTTTKRVRSEKPPVDSWQKMRSLLKKKFLPTEYSRDNFAMLQTLRKGTKSVEDYTREFEELLLRCDLQENEEQTFELYKEDEDFKDTFSKCLVRPHGEFLIKDGSRFGLERASGKIKSTFGPKISEIGPRSRNSREAQRTKASRRPTWMLGQFGRLELDALAGLQIKEDTWQAANGRAAEIIRLEQKIFYFDEVLFAEGSWYEPPYSYDYTLFAEEQIEANKVAIRERAKLLESVRKEKEFAKRLCEGSEMMQKMLCDFQRERLEAESKADKLVNDLCMVVELKRSLQSQIREINVQKEALEPKTNPESINQQVPVLEDSPSFTPSQKPESITTLARATVVMLPKSLPSQVTTSIVVQKVEPTKGPDSEPPMLSQEKEEEVLPIAINGHLLNCVEDTPPEEPVLEEIEPTTSPQDSNVHESKEEPIDEEKPTPSIEPYATNDSSDDSDHTFFDSLLDRYDYVCPKDGWNLKSWDELLVSDDEDSSLGEGTIIIIKPQMDSQSIEDKEEINFAIKANDVDQLRRLPPPPTYTKSPPYILLPPSRRDESRILDLDRATNQTRWHQKRVRRAKLYDSRIGKSQKKWDIDELLYDPKWRILLFLHAPASLEVTIEFLCSLRFLNDEEEVKSVAEVTSTTKVTFTMMGRLLNLTVADLGWLIGLYTLDETRSLAFANLPDQLDPKFDAKKFWQAHGHGRFHSGASLARNWARPSWRILHHALAHSYFGRSQEPDVVFDSDMLFFWSLATFVARFLFAQSTCNHQFVLCGPMVTLLARGLCMSVPDVLPKSTSMFRPPTQYLAQIVYNKEDKEAHPRKQHTIPMTLRELSQAMFAFQDSVDSRLRSMETLLLTQQWQVEEILDYVREQGTKKAEHGQVLNKANVRVRLVAQLKPKRAETSSPSSLLSALCMYKVVAPKKIPDLVRSIGPPAI
ncbi:unnamed protein product [Cuscuta campestris]|uniref:Retrotransposon gag domain-containing protein n=1 Tax=Cuscuta campestris TaxID=132261 RepID=A0A484N0B2_9ASTE|nr:unnamed protein product [Cuscuta campestris]